MVYTMKLLFAKLTILSAILSLGSLARKKRPDSLFPVMGKENAFPYIHNFNFIRSSASVNFPS